MPMNASLAFKADDVESLLGLGQCELELKNYPAAVDKLQSVCGWTPRAYWRISICRGRLPRWAGLRTQSTRQLSTS